MPISAYDGYAGSRLRISFESEAFTVSISYEMRFIKSPACTRVKSAYRQGKYFIKYPGAYTAQSSGSDLSSIWTEDRPIRRRQHKIPP